MERQTNREGGERQRHTGERDNEQQGETERETEVRTEKAVEKRTKTGTPERMERVVKLLKIQKKIFAKLMSLNKKRGTTKNYHSYSQNFRRRPSKCLRR